LTPKEFILAGDQLVHMCPTWQWKPAVDDKHKRAELPDDKQYLYTRVPCQKRVRDVMELKTVEKDVTKTLLFSKFINLLPSSWEMAGPWLKMNQK